MNFRAHALSLNIFVQLDLLLFLVRANNLKSLGKNEFWKLPPPPAGLGGVIIARYRWWAVWSPSVAPRNYPFPFCYTDRWGPLRRGFCVVKSRCLYSFCCIGSHCENPPSPTICCSSRLIEPHLRESIGGADDTSTSSTQSPLPRNSDRWIPAALHRRRGTVRASLLRRSASVCPALHRLGRRRCENW